MAAKCLNVYVCSALPCYNFTLWFLSSWVLITVLCTVCQTYMTLMLHGKIVLTQILAKQARMTLNGLKDETFITVVPLLLLCHRYIENPLLDIYLTHTVFQVLRQLLSSHNDYSHIDILYV